ncbi:MAG TPA: pyridoxal phosphate-dependent aminotransferase [Rectinemataceae bacterium]|nr:pyridoxal phosphate-dependent aminotransferase [Rectinemataceae bacterium]
MAIARKMKNYVDNGAMIKRMFEEGARLKALYGADKVFDFSIGNPNVAPPEIFKSTLKAVVEADAPGLHAYMPNAGLPETRKAIAARLTAEQGVHLEGKHVVVTCGAAGGLNIVFKALLEPGDEVLVSSPYFVEYGFIADNHGGILKTVPTLPDFGLDVAAIEAAMGPRTKIVLVNTPNNPTGRIYSSDSLVRLGAAMERRGAALGHAIYLVSDEPYRKLAYGGVAVPSPLASYPNSIVVTSYSKELSLPGERIGFVAVNPGAEDLVDLMEALSLANRILGFVNAPSLMQKVIAALIAQESRSDGQPACVDVAIYQCKRDKLAAGLNAAGYEFDLPEGAFYFFVKIPGPGDPCGAGNSDAAGDPCGDAAFLDRLRAENILVVPGSAFGTPGYFRIAYCVEDSTIEGAMPGFLRAMRKSQAIKK